MFLSLMVAVVAGDRQCLASQQVEGLTVEEWREDLHQLVEHVVARHRNPWHSVSESDFRQAVDKLDDQLTALPPNSIVLEFSRLLALVGDGHTRLTLPVSPSNFGFQWHHSIDPEPGNGAPKFHTLPVRFAMFEEGLHIIAATEKYANLIGSKVTGIGSKSVDQAARSVAPYISHDTPSALNFLTTKYFSIPELLVEAGVSADLNNTTLSLTSSDGTSRDVLLNSLPYSKTPVWVTLIAL